MALLDALKRAAGDSSPPPSHGAAPELEELCEELLACIKKSDAKGLASCLRECVHCCKDGPEVTVSIGG